MVLWIVVGGAIDKKYKFGGEEMRKVMRKVLSLIILIVLVGVLFSGCNKIEEFEESNLEKQYTIGIGQFGEHGSLDNCKNGFIEGLAEEGLVEGENLTIIYENAQFDIALASQIAQHFLAKKVDLIAAIATPMAQASFNAAMDTDTPVVFTAVTDPEAAMLTEGNITGTSDKLQIEAQLKLIREILPEAKKIGILYTTSEVNSESSIAEYKDLAGDYGFEIIAGGVNVSSEIPLAMDKILKEVDAITNITDNTVVGSLPVVLSKATEKGIPVFGSEIEQVKLGCVASEGIEYLVLGKQTGRMAAAILKGEKTAAETQFEIIEESSLYINSEVMNNLGLELPQELVERAIDVVNK